MSKQKIRIKSTECPNCHTVFTDEHSNYCANCGQENHTHKLPVKHFVIELIESLSHFDTKVLASLKDLVLYPGLIIQKFNDNKRARYVPPIRLYAFMSFIFFLILTTVTTKEIEKVSNLIQNTSNKGHKGVITFIHKTVVDAPTMQVLIKLPKLTNTLIDSILYKKNIQTDWINTRLLNSIVRLEKGELTLSDLYNKFIKYSSYAIFILMPIFALLLMLFYRKRNYFYSEFLVFSIYYHTFIFGVFSLLIILQSLFNIKGNYIAPFLLLSVFSYMGLALKKVFVDSVILTILKTVLLSLSYLFLLMLSIIVLLLSSVV
jgi:ribosomal protein S27AE